MWYVSTPQSAADGLCRELSFHSVLTSQEEHEMTEAVNLATSEKDTTDIKHNGHAMACEESTCWNVMTFWEIAQWGKLLLSF